VALVEFILRVTIEGPGWLTGRIARSRYPAGVVTVRPVNATDTATQLAPAEIATGFLERLAAHDLDGAFELMADDAEWINVTLPTVRGKSRIERIIRALDGRGEFRAHFHHVAVEGNTVLTERTDELSVGPFTQRFWVYGRFEIRDGKIAVWRDSFDWLDILVSLVRAAAGAISPGLNRPWPGPGE
jgi:limonene-1,2-epoxide hydrolase